MKRIFFYIILLVIVPVIVSAQSYGHQGGGTSFKSVTDTTNNSTGAGKTFWFGDSPWIHDGDYYKKLGYYHANGLQVGFGYRFGRATGTNGQVMALATGSTPDSTYWTSYTADTGALWLRNAGNGFIYPNTAADNVVVGSSAGPVEAGDEFTVYKIGTTGYTNPAVVNINRGSGNYYPARYSFKYGTEMSSVELYNHTAAFSSGGEPGLRLNLGGVNNLVTSNRDSVYVPNRYLDYTGLELCREGNTGFRLFKADVSSNGVAAKVKQLFRIDRETNYFYVGDTTTGDKDWRLYAGDDAAWSSYLGWDDGNNTWDLAGGNYTFNDASGDYDFRVESDADANALVVDGGLNAVGIGTSAPDKKLEINSATGACMRHTYNDNNGSATNYVDYSVSSSGDATITPSGGDVNVAGNMTAGADGKLTIGSWTSAGYGILKYSTLATETEYAFLQGTGGVTYVNAKSGTSLRFALGGTPCGRLESNAFRFGDNTSPAGTYDVEVKDSLHVGGNLLLGTYGGAYSYIHPGSGAWVSSCTADLKNIGPEKNIINILDLAKQVEVREWSFDSSKVYEKFVKPAGYDTLAKAAQDSIREAYEKPAKAKASELSRKRHFTPTAENWYTISQHFGGSSKEINYEQVVWAQFLMIQKLNEKVEALEKRVDKLEGK